MSVKTTVIAAGIAGTIGLGALVTWGGTDALLSAKTKITQQAEAMGIYKSNETKLIEKAGSLKSQIAALNQAIKDLQNTTGDNAELIASLQADVLAKQIALDNLNIELAAAQTNGESMAQRIDDLTAELDKANAEAADLKVTVDNTNAPTSDQEAVDRALSGDSGTITPPPAPSQGEEPTAYAKYVDLIRDVPYSLTTDGTMKLNNVNGTIVVWNTSNNDRQVKINGTSYVIPAESTSGTAVTIGTVEQVVNKNLTVHDQYGTEVANTAIYLIQQ